MSDNSRIENKKRLEKRLLEKVENDIGELRTLIKDQLGAIANELMRAEARDEWMTQHITEMRKTIRKQSQTLDEIQSTIQQSAPGFH